MHRSWARGAPCIVALLGVASLAGCTHAGDDPGAHGTPEGAPVESPAATWPAEAHRWPAARAQAPQTPALAFSPCPNIDRPLGAPEDTECGEIAVPLDYAEPDGEQITLSVYRIPAAHPEGAVFINPGGPGQSAGNALGEFASILGDYVRAGHDLIAVEPRGVSSKALAACASGATAPPLAPTYPRGGDVPNALTYEAFVRSACADSLGPLAAQLSTGNTARDADLVRQALGHDQIAFYGMSYGTVLAATYAVMFEGHVQALILDGVVDPVAWVGQPGSEEPVTARLGSGHAAQQVLEAIAQQCDRESCAGDAGLLDRWERVTGELEAGPVVRGADVLTLPMVIEQVIAALYDPSRIDRLVELVMLTDDALRDGRDLPRWDLDAQPSGGFALAQSQARNQAQLGGSGLGGSGQADAAWWEALPHEAIMCADTANPADPNRWVELAEAAETQGRFFDAAWLWDSSVCAGWPLAHGRYTGPFDISAQIPVLLLSMSHDPATPASSADAVAQRAGNAATITIDGFGHTAGGRSSCAQELIRKTIIDGELPDQGARCG